MKIVFFRWMISICYVCVAMSRRRLRWLRSMRPSEVRLYVSIRWWMTFWTIFPSIYLWRIPEMIFVIFIGIKLLPSIPESLSRGLSVVRMQIYFRTRKMLNISGKTIWRWWSWDVLNIWRIIQLWAVRSVRSLQWKQLSLREVSILILSEYRGM